MWFLHKTRQVLLSNPYTVLYISVMDNGLLQRNKSHSIIIKSIEKSLAEKTICSIKYIPKTVIATYATPPHHETKGTRNP